MFFDQRKRSQRTIGAIGIFFCTASVLIPLSAWAAAASPEAVLSAVTEGEKAGVCTTQNVNASSDCKKIITTCSSSDWQKYIANNYQNNGGSISFGSGSRVVAGRNLKDSEVTSVLSVEATNALNRHFALFPSCRRNAQGCPVDITACGLGAEYPFTSNGTSYIAKVTAHYNRGCEPAGNVGVNLVFGSSGAPVKSDATGEALAYLQADWALNSTRPPGPIQRGTCFCQCTELSGEPACNGKENGFPIIVGEALTRGQCARACGRMPIATSKCQVADIVTDTGSASDSTAQSTAWCFTPSECAEQEGFFEADAGRCGTSQGRCFAAEPEIELNVPLGDVKVIRGFNQYVVTAFRYLISIVGVAATVMFTWGAFLYLLGSAIPSIKSGRSIMIDAVFGLILVLASTMILRSINPATTNLQPLKVYMVNTVQFLHTAFCKDVGANERLAEAGKRPDLTPYETVAAKPETFTVQPKDAKCGTSYWVRNSIGSACDGSMCPNRGEACVSCAGSDTIAPKTTGRMSGEGGDGASGSMSGEGGDTGAAGAEDLPEPCRGRAPTESVCQKTVFAGTINYTDKRVPEEVRLLLVCNAAQDDIATAEPADVSDRWQEIIDEPGIAGHSLNAQTSDVAVVGQGAYRFTFDEDTLNDAEKFCADKGDFRGALISVQYNDDTVPPSIRAAGSAALLAAGAFFPPASPLALAAAAAVAFSGGADDFAILSKRNCGGSQAPFDAYGMGTKTSFDSTDIARGMLCGFARKKLLDGTGSYWTKDDLFHAINGDAPIICNFSLSRDTAPSDPELCRVKEE